MLFFILIFLSKTGDNVKLTFITLIKKYLELHYGVDDTIKGTMSPSVMHMAKRIIFLFYFSVYLLFIYYLFYILYFIFYYLLFIYFIFLLFFVFCLVDKPKWIPDDDRTNCKACERPFTVTRRRHHCR